ncbi:hypothetical protein BDN67DRAFT_913768, partial [Paxillus ammoniavirescens]
MWGGSTCNSRIERLWVDVGVQYVHRWRAFFTRLEDLHQLDPQNQHHLWLLHYVFLDEINNDCKQFQQEWNHHPISGQGHNKLPNVLTNGKYHDDYENVHPEVLQRYYGVDQQDRDVDGDQIYQQIADDQEIHVQHDLIDVPHNTSPFQSPEAEQTFILAYKEVMAAGIIPEGYGVAQGEWGGGLYPESEVIRVGKGGKE